MSGEIIAAIITGIATIIAAIIGISKIKRKNINIKASKSNHIIQAGRDIKIDKR